MKCAMCGSKMYEEKAELFHYTDCGLSKVYLRGISILKCTNDDCGEEEVTIPNIEVLHSLLAEKIATQANTLRPEEIRFLRTHLGFSGADFASKIGVSPETVSRWEKGTVNMKAAVEKLLRVLILSKAGPFRNYDQLDAFASNKSRTAHKLVYRIKKSHWEEDKAA